MLQTVLGEQERDRSELGWLQSKVGGQPSFSPSLVFVLGLELHSAPRHGTGVIGCSQCM